MRFAKIIGRRQLLKANKAKLKKIRKRIQLNELLIRLSVSAHYLMKSGDYCSILAIELHEELTNHFGKRTEYFQMLADLSLRLSLRQFRPGPDAPSLVSIQNEYQAVVARAESYRKKIEEGLEMRRTEFEKINKLTNLGVYGGLRIRAIEDPIGLEMEMEQIIKKTKEVTRYMEGLKGEWNDVKDGLNGGIDDCVQQVNLLIGDVTAQELGPGEE